MKLDDDQRLAVAHSGNVSLASCPGSGKTRAIVGKILAVLDEVRDSTRRIACITYTNAAVEEIENRLADYASSGDSVYWEVNTIHSFCLNNILRPYFHLIPHLCDGFDVVTPDDDWFSDAVDHICDRYGLDGNRASEAFERVQRGPKAQVPPEIGNPSAVQEFFRLADLNRKVTFSDIVFFSAELVRKHPYLARGLASRFAWLIVDEFQDTSFAQVDILRAIWEQARSQFFVVGDPNQSIYAFAGASPELMSEFAKSIEAKSDIRLVGNYRCSSRIVTRANRLCPIKPAMRAVGEDRDHAFEPQLVRCADPLTGIFENFLPVVDGLNIPLGKTAILAPWWITLLNIGRGLRERSIPVIGPGARPYKRTHEFAALAEALCAFATKPDGDAASQVQKAVFFTLLDLSGESVPGIYGYDGKRIVCRLLNVARDLRESHPAAKSWLLEASKRCEDILIAEELIPPSAIGRMQASARGIIADIVRNKIDIENLAAEELGFYAAPKDCVNLLTIHRAKGREFDAVAVVDVHEGRIPHFAAKTTAEFEEAKRVLYVAVTRPKKVLMLFVDPPGTRNTPSRFLRSDGMGFFA